MPSHVAPKSASKLNRELANLVSNLNVDRRSTCSDIPPAPLRAAERRYHSINQMSSSSASKLAMTSDISSAHASTLSDRITNSCSRPTAPSRNDVLYESSRPSQDLISTFCNNRDSYKPSQFLGVHSRRGKWHVRINIEGKRLHRGPFETEEEAARKYDEMAVLAGKPTNFCDGALECIAERTSGDSKQPRILAKLNSKLQVSPTQSRRRGPDILSRSDQSTLPQHEDVARCDIDSSIEGECAEGPPLREAPLEDNKNLSNPSLHFSSSGGSSVKLPMQALPASNTTTYKAVVTKKSSPKCSSKFVRFSCKAVNDSECAVVSAKKKCVDDDTESMHDRTFPLPESVCSRDEVSKKSTDLPTNTELFLPKHDSTVDVDVDHSTESQVNLNCEQPSSCRENDLCIPAATEQPGQSKRKRSKPPPQLRLSPTEPQTIHQVEVSSRFCSANSNEALSSRYAELKRNAAVQTGEEAPHLWVQCDVCEKWRLISVPANFNADEKWVCSMNSSDPLQNYCEAPEISWKTSVQSGETVQKRPRVRGQLYKSLRALSCGKFRVDSDEQKLLRQRISFAEIDLTSKSSRKQPRWLRYERYRKAHHIGEVFRLGGSGKDLIEDLKEDRAVLVDSSRECLELHQEGGSNIHGGGSCSGSSQGMVVISEGSLSRVADVHASSAEVLARTHRISEALSRFQNLDPNVWFLRTEIRPEVQRLYCEANEGKPGAAPFSLSARGKEKLAQGTKEILRDWDKYLRSNHPGFSSYGATVGEHDGAEQEKHTRVVGPSEAHWNSFHERYGWFKDVLAEVEDFVRSEVMANYSAAGEERSAQRQAKQAERNEKRRLRRQPAPSQNEESLTASSPLKQTPKRGELVESISKECIVNHNDCEHDSYANDDAAEIAAELEADRLFDMEAVEEFMLPCELHDMHILRQVSSSTEGGGAVFDDHQDRHAEIHNGKTLRWTVTLLVHSTGPPTGFFMWNSRTRSSGDTSSIGSVCGVLPYEAAGHGVLFPSMAWHRSVLAARSHWPFEAMKFSFFFAAPTDRARRYHRASLSRNSIVDRNRDRNRTKKGPQK